MTAAVRVSRRMLSHLMLAKELAAVQQSQGDITMNLLMISTSPFVGGRDITIRYVW
jgi:hypothetical protein